MKKLKKLKLSKVVVTSLSNAEQQQIIGGFYDGPVTFAPSCTCIPTRGCNCSGVGGGGTVDPYDHTTHVSVHNCYNESDGCPKTILTTTVLCLF